VPEAENVSSYWSRMDFFKHAAELYELQGGVRSTKAAETSVLLEVTIDFPKAARCPQCRRQDQQKAQDALVKTSISMRRSPCGSRWRCRKSVKTSSSTRVAAVGRGPDLHLAGSTWRRKGRSDRRCRSRNWFQAVAGIGPRFQKKERGTTGRLWRRPSCAAHPGSGIPAEVKGLPE